MAAVKTLVRVFSYLFHSLLALFLLGVSGLALLTGAGSLRLEMLPWSGSTLAYILLCSSLFALASVVLAMRGKLTVLFFLWSLAAAGLLWKGYVFSMYKFEPGEVKPALWLLCGSLVALLGAWFCLRPARKF